MKIENKYNFGLFFPLASIQCKKAEGYYQSSGLDLYCNVLILYDVHVLI